MKCYCIFCKSGQEQTVAKLINAIYKDLTVIAPKRVLQEKRNNKWEQRSRALMPGYVFLFTQTDRAPIQLRERVTDMYKFLRYEGGIKELVNEDYDYAMWINNNHGTIAPSKILIDGQRILVTEGPLLDCHGKIVRIDKHKRRVTVEFEFDGQKRIVQLSAECITSMEELATQEIKSAG